MVVCAVGVEEEEEEEVEGDEVVICWRARAFDQKFG
jgi:hypothetical protein